MQHMRMAMAARPATHLILQSCSSITQRVGEGCRQREGPTETMMSSVNDVC